MPFALEQLTQGLAVAGQIKSQTLNNSNDSCTDIDMSKFRRVLVVVNVGANTGSLVVKLQDATSKGGTYADISGAALTAITAANKVATIEIRDDQTRGWLKVVATEGNSSNCAVGCLALGGEGDWKPANAQDIAAVTQRLVK